MSRTQKIVGPEDKMAPWTSMEYMGRDGMGTRHGVWAEMEQAELGHTWNLA